MLAAFHTPEVHGARLWQLFIVLVDLCLQIQLLQEEEGLADNLSNQASDDCPSSSRGLIWIVLICCLSAAPDADARCLDQDCDDVRDDVEPVPSGCVHEKG